jgi:hypothetical protein
VRFSSIVVIAIVQSWLEAIAFIAEVGQMAT